LRSTSGNLYFGAASSSGRLGTYYLFLQTDPYNQVTEENETNNLFATPIQVMVRKPDLVPTAFSATTATTVDAGQQVGLQWTVANQAVSGGTAFQPWYDGIYLSTKNVFDASATLLTYFLYTSNLAGGANYTASGNASLSLAPGTYYLFLVTDAFNNVTEENETNNLFATPIQVTVLTGSGSVVGRSSSERPRPHSNPSGQRGAARTPAAGPTAEGDAAAHLYPPTTPLPRHRRQARVPGKSTGLVAPLRLRHS